MTIKTRQSGRTIKTFDRAGNLAQKTKGGITYTKQAAEQTVNQKHLSGVDYASDKTQQTEARLAYHGIAGAERLGRWGVRETGSLLRRYLRKGSVRIDLPTNQIHAPKTRAALSSGKVAGKTTATTAKASVKATQKAMMTAKKAIQAIIKWGKVLIKANHKCHQGDCRCHQGACCHYCCRRLGGCDYYIGDYPFGCGG